jgi:hypothetical protein
MVNAQGLCKEAPWGPWQGGMLTECFQQLTIMSVLSAVMIAGGVLRLVQLRHVDLLFAKYGTIQILKMFLCMILAFSYFLSLAAKLLFVNWIWFQIMSDARDFVSWTICFIVIRREFQVGAAHWRIVRAWWVLKFIGNCLVLQALRGKDKDIYHEYGYEYDVLVTLIRFSLSGILATLGLWVKGGEIKSAYSKLMEDRQNRHFGYSSSKRFDIEGKTNPYQEANILSRIFFVWPSSLVALGSKRVLDFSDLWDIPEEDSAEYCVTKLAQNWDEQKRTANPSLFKAVCQTHWRIFLLSALGKLAQDIHFHPPSLSSLSSLIFLSTVSFSFFKI